MNPLRTNLYRKSLSLRKTKTDRVDARTIAAMLLSDTGLKPYTDTAYHARLNIEDTLSAANTLTADAFRTWVLLALNQGGFVWTGELDDAAENELIEHAYLHPNGDGFVFHAGGGGESAIPKVLEKITAFYPDWTVRDIRNIMGRLDDILADDRANEIIEFWGGNMRT